MTELVKIVVSDLIDFGLIEYFIRYVDDTLLPAKEDNIDTTVHQFNVFGGNLKFIIDKFTDSDVPFLDIKIDRDITDFFYRNTHRGQYIDFASPTQWKVKAPWIKALHHKADKVSSTKKSFLKQFD